MINISNRRECFFDNFLIDEEKTTAEKRLHKPTRREVMMELNDPWEENHTAMFSTFFAEGKWHTYYCTENKDHLVCYAMSDDCIHWTKPNLGRVEYGGTKDNNILFDPALLAEFDFVSFNNMSAFYDENPTCPPDEKYKMVAWWTGHASLVLLTSADPINFNKCRLITDDGAFDSQNRMFWSEEHKKYFCYYRDDHEAGKAINLMDRSYSDKTANALFDPDTFALREPGAGTYSFMRDIRVIESKDAVNWTQNTPITYNGGEFQLYHNCVLPYPRAPHIFVAFPLRYVERKGWSKNYEELCGREDRLRRMKQMARLGLAVTDSLFMTSRDGYDFTKYDEAFIQPPAENPDAFVYGDGSATPALVEIPSEIPGADNEYMIMVRESFRLTTDSRPKLVKYTIRLDGFVSLHAGGEERQIITKEFVYNGTELYANIQTSARGSAYFTLKSGDEEYTSVEIFGNSTDKRIRFEDDEAVKRLSGKSIVLEIKMYDCDIYSIKFD